MVENNDCDEALMRGWGSANGDVGIDAADDSGINDRGSIEGDEVVRDVRLRVLRARGRRDDIVF